MVAPRRLSAGERRASIVSAAERLFAGRGYAGTRIEDIVDAAGVTKPILYRHFASKKALHQALLEHHRDALAAAALDEYLADGTLEQRLPAMIDAWFAYVERHPYAWRMLFADTTGDVEVRALHRDLHDRQRAADAAILRENLPALTEAQIAPLAEVVRSSLTGLALWWHDHPQVVRQTLVDTMVDVLSGILARHAAQRPSGSGVTNPGKPEPIARRLT
jgi:AcrR family transcriptional regulator